MRVYYSDFITKLQSDMLQTRDHFYVNVYSRFHISKQLGSDSSIVAGIYGEVVRNVA